MRSGHVMGKTTFVNVNDGLTLFLETLNLFAKGMPGAFVRLWVREGFFYMSLQVCAALARWLYSVSVLI